MKVATTTISLIARRLTEGVDCAYILSSIEAKYGRSIADWQRVIADFNGEKHMEIVGHLKSEFGIGHGHANALVAWTLAGNVAAS